MEKSGNLMWYQTSCLESNISHQKRYSNLGLGKKCPTIACLLILALIYPIIYEVLPWLSWAASSSSYLEGTANSFVWHHLFSQQQYRAVGRSENPEGGSGDWISSNQASFSGSLERWLFQTFKKSQITMQRCLALQFWLVECTESRCFGAPEKNTWLRIYSV